MIDSLFHFATLLPHPSDIGLVKPSGGFELLPVLFGVLVFVGLSQFVLYGIKPGFGDDICE